MTRDDHGLVNLLALDGEIIEQAGGFWVKFDAKQVEPSAGRGYSHRRVIEYDHNIRQSVKLSLTHTGALNNLW